MGVKNRIMAMGINQAYKYLEKDPETNMGKLMDLVDRFAGDMMAPQRDVIRKVIHDPDSNWHKLIASLWTDIDSEVLKTLFNNFILNVNFIGWEQ